MTPNLTEAARQMLHDTGHHIYQEARGWVCAGGPDGPFAASTAAIEAATEAALRSSYASARATLFRATLLERGLRGEFADGVTDLTPIYPASDR